MIDLTKPQILTEPVKCWVSNDNYNYVQRWLVGRDEEGMYWWINSIEHDKTMTIEQVMTLSKTEWTYCTLTDPCIKTKRPMTHAEIFQAIAYGAVVRYINDKKNSAGNGWHTHFKQSEHILCYNYTGTDTDVWQPMEIEE